ncbi:MAG TPA: hypothetical protein VGG43_06885 [Acidimicrobiales bacterium]
MSHGTRRPESQAASLGGQSSDGSGGTEHRDAAHRRVKHLPRVSRRLAVGAILAVGLVAAACSSGTSAVSSTATTGSATTTSATVIGSTTNPTLGKILVNAAGATLYRFAADQNGQSSCSGACAQLWPPFTVTNGLQPKAAGGLVGVFGTSKRADGTIQVTYNGSPLYTYSGDKTAGSTAGQGFDGMWFVVNVSATPVAASTATTAPGATSPSTTRAPSTPAITPTTVQQTAPTSPPATSPPVTSPPATSPPATSPPTTAAPPTTSPPTTMGGGGYGY